MNHGVKRPNYLQHSVPVEALGDPENQLVGMIALEDLLKARELTFHEEQSRERVLRLRLPPSLRLRERPPKAIA